MTPYHLKDFLGSSEPQNGRFYSVAVDGRGGSGKTVFAERLKELLPDFVFLNGDEYFEPIKNQVVWGGFNDKRFNEDVIIPLRNDSSFTYRPYDWDREPHITEKQTTVTHGFCLERCFSFTFNLGWDLKIWVETPKEVCLERGVSREMMPKDRVLAAWKIWQATEDKYVIETKPQEMADLIIDGTESFEKQLVQS